MCDGDILLTVKNKTLNNIVRRNQDKIAPLYFEMKKADPQELNPENIYNGIVSSFKYGKIGIYSNAISKIWNKEDLSQEDLDIIKLLVAESNWSIDAAKTLYMPDRPDGAKTDITQRTKYKLPHFFIHAKDKLAPIEERNPRSKDKRDGQCEFANSSTMNRIEAAIINPRITFSKSLGRFEYKRLLSDMKFQLSSDSYRVLERYDYWNIHQNMVFHSEENKNSKDNDYAYEYIRSNIIDETGLDVNYIVDSIVSFLYREKKNDTKKLLWACFGEELVNNLKKNTGGLGKICQVCGKRFKPRDNANSKYCGDECFAQGKLEYDRQYREKS